MRKARRELYLSVQRSHQEALPEARRALHRDPLNLMISRWARLRHYLAHDYSHAIEQIELCLLFQRSFFRWRSSVLKFKLPPWQNSLRRKAAAHKLGHQLLNVRTGPSLRPRLANRCVGQTLAFEFGSE